MGEPQGWPASSTSDHGCTPQARMQWSTWGKFSCGCRFVLCCHGDLGLCTLLTQLLNELQWQRPTSTLIPEKQMAKSEANNQKESWVMGNLQYRTTRLPSRALQGPQLDVRMAAFWCSCPCRTGQPTLALSLTILKGRCHSSLSPNRQQDPVYVLEAKQRKCKSSIYESTFEPKQQVQVLTLGYFKEQYHDRSRISMTWCNCVVNTRL